MKIEKCKTKHWIPFYIPSQSLKKFNQVIKKDLWFEYKTLIANKENLWQA